MSTPSGQAVVALPRTEAPHLPALDGARGVAILLVMVHHFAYGAEGTALPARLFVSVAEAGWIGVDLFFVLSGFLITGILLRAKESAHFFRNFYARRTLRIFPLYYGYLFVMCVLVARFTNFDAERAAELRSYGWWLWLYGTNLLICLRNAFLVASVNHFWTLAIEEHFYLFWPTVVRWVSRPRMWLACLICISAAVLIRCAFEASQVWPMAPLVLTVCRVDSLAMGALLAVLMQAPASRQVVERASRPVLWLTAPVVLFFLLGGENVPGGRVLLHTVGYTLLALFFAAFLSQILQSQGWLKRCMSFRPLRFFGFYAYGLYVFHHPLRIVLQRVMPFEKVGHALGSYWLGLVVHSLCAGALSVVVALLSFHLFEKQFLRLKRYFEYQDGPAARSATAASPSS